MSRSLLAPGHSAPVAAREVAIAACDLAEVIGSAIALNLLFGLPVVWGVCITALDVQIVFCLQQFRFRYVEQSGRRGKGRVLLVRARST
jgi:Mn2+/Fe2+ NRAMP family transporter